MFCPNCGTELPEGTTYCSVCASKSNEAKAEYPPVSAPPYNSQYTKPSSSQKPELAIASLVLGIAGFLGLGIIGFALAYCFGKKYIESGSVENLRYAEIGKLIGKIGIIINIVSFALIVLFCVLACILAVSDPSSVEPATTVLNSLHGFIL